MPYPPDDKTPLLKIILKIFRIIGTRDEKGHAYQPFILSDYFKSEKLQFFTSFPNFFKAILGSAGLRIDHSTQTEAREGGEGGEKVKGEVPPLRVLFSILYPLYVYTRLSESLILLTSRDYLDSGEWWDHGWEITK